MIYDGQTPLGIVLAENRELQENLDKMRKALLKERRAVKDAKDNFRSLSKMYNQLKEDFEDGKKSYKALERQYQLLAEQLPIYFDMKGE